MCRKTETVSTHSHQCVAERPSGNSVTMRERTNCPWQWSAPGKHQLNKQHDTTSQEVILKGESLLTTVLTAKMWTLLNAPTNLVTQPAAKVKHPDWWQVTKDQNMDNARTWNFEHYTVHQAESPKARDGPRCLRIKCWSLVLQFSPWPNNAT